MSDLHHLSAASQVQALRAGEISARDLASHYLERIAALDDGLGAFVTVTPDLALAEADRADERLAAGEQAPLLGLPIGIKDLYATAGVRTTFGSAALTDVIPAADSWTAGLLRQAGAVFLGKTNTAEFGATCYTHNSVTAQPAVTPYDRTRYSSGSSGGAATAVAAGLLPVASGGDGAGSTRTPAATCHLVGVKPTRGLVTSAVPATSFTNITVEGPLARTVQDAALVLDVMAQPSYGDLYGWRPDTSFVEATRRPPTRPLRVAVWTDTGLDGVAPHAESVRAVERAAAILRQFGHELVEVALPANYDEPVRQALLTMFASSVSLTVSSAVPPERRDLLRPYTQHLTAVGATLSGSDVLAAHGVLARYASAFLATFEHVDAALTPVTNGSPVPIGYFDEEGAAAIADRMLAWSCYTPFANLTGQPAIALPSHLDDDGLPHAIQLVGRPRHDADLLALAAQLEGAGLWDDVHPPCWNQ